MKRRATGRTYCLAAQEKFFGDSRPAAPSDAHNAELGNRIFLTWSGELKDLGKAKRLARQMAETGTTFRGCSFDVRVYVKERCPVCSEWGLKETDTPWDQDARIGPASASGAIPSHWQPKRRKVR